jgi:aminoglycoside phosphotransferase (APT) family kinase protein
VFGGSTTASLRTFLVRGVRGARGVESAIPVVVKRYDRAIAGVDGARHAFAEARGLTAAEQAGVPAPRLLAIDADGARTGAPALAMTRLPGTPLANPADGVGEWVAGLAGTLVRIAEAPRPTIELPAMESWREPTDRDLPPDWMTAEPTGRAAWRAAVDLFDAGVLGSSGRFIHRDYHPLNVVWDGPTISGVIDWANACVGPIEVDVSRCRVNVALVAGINGAERFLAELGDLGRDYDRAWDLETVFSLLGNVDVFLTGNDLGAGMTADGIRRTLAAFVLRAT